MLAITGPGLNLIEEIQMNDGNGFDSLRKVIKRAIRDHLTARSSGKEAAVTAMESLVYEVELEPVQEPVLEDEKQRAGNSSHESGRWRGSDGNQDDDFII